MNYLRVTIALLLAAIARAAPAANPPLSPGQDAVLASVRNYALQYSKNLPNFFCSQITYREISPPIASSDRILSSDMIEETVTFVRESESYAVRAINGKKVTGIKHLQMTGAISAGEFGSVLRGLFDPMSHTVFTFDKMAGLRGRKAYVFAFQVPKEAGFRMADKKANRDIIVPYHGTFFADAETKEVMRVTTQVELPPKFPVKIVEGLVDYKHIKIAENEYNLPFHSVIQMMDEEGKYTNKIDYKAYRKFTAESVLSFDGGHSAPAGTLPAATQAEMPETSAEPVAASAPSQTQAPVAAQSAPPAHSEVKETSSLFALPLPPPPPPLAPGTGELTSRDRDFVFRAKLTVVTVPVVVRTAQGQAVGDLRRENFQLYDNGKRQEITSFVVQRPGERDGQPATKSVPAGDAAKTASPPLHFIAYVFDDLNLKFGDLVRVRDAAQRNMDTLQPTDRAAIFTTSGQGALDFTDNRVALHDALMKLEARQSNNSGIKDCPDVSYYMADQMINSNNINDLQNNQPLQIATSEAMACLHLDPRGKPMAVLQAQSTARKVLAKGDQEGRIPLVSLKDIVRRVSLEPGTRTLIFVSPGFFLTRDLQPEVLELADRAIRANVTISALDARGVYAPDAIGDIEQNSYDGNTQQWKSQYQRDEARLSSGALKEMAAGTGGAFVEGSNDMDSGFGQLATVPACIYLLGFAPDSLKPDGSFHALKVKIKSHEKVNLQARRGYFAPKQPVSEEAGAQEEIDKAVLSRDEIHDLPVELHTQVLKSTDAGATLKVRTSVDLKELRFRKDQGQNRNDLTVVSAIFDNNGEFVSGTVRVLQMRLKDETFAALGHQPPINVISSFDVKPGVYLIRLVVRDSEGQLMTAENGTVQIP